MFIDVEKAHLNGKVPVKLPDGTNWRLKRWLYGMRSAAQAWKRSTRPK